MERSQTQESLDRLRHVLLHAGRERGGLEQLGQLLAVVVVGLDRERLFVGFDRLVGALLLVSHAPHRGVGALELGGLAHGRDGGLLAAAHVPLLEPAIGQDHICGRQRDPELRLPGIHLAGQAQEREDLCGSTPRWSWTAARNTNNSAGGEGWVASRPARSCFSAPSRSEGSPEACASDR